MKHFLLFVLCLVFSLNAIAGEAVLLNKDQPAPFQGFLITREAAEKVRLTSLDLEFKVKENELLTKQISLTDEQLKRNEDQIINLNKKLIDAQDNSFFSKYGFFIGGVLTTILITYGVSQATK